MAKSQTDHIKGRLKGVRRRKEARQEFACETMRFKMRLVRRKRPKK
ncbi:MAG: hypothetical protein PVI59_08370 [Anaerolineae bacterium]|jgi:hypothetical protein